MLLITRTRQIVVNSRSPLVGVKALHTVVWLSIETCVAYLLYAGVAGRTGPAVKIAGGVVAAECAVFAANRFSCPLTDLAQSLGDDVGSVTDLYLPTWMARNLPVIHVPVLLIAAVLTGRNAHRAGTSRRSTRLSQTHVFTTHLANR